MRKPTFTKFFRLVGVSCLLLLPILAWADTAPLVGDAHINPGDASNFGGLPASKSASCADRAATTCP